MSLPDKAFPVSWDQFHRDARALAWRLADNGQQWRAMVCITRGGLVPAAIICRELNIRMIETVCVASYHDYDTQGQMKVLKGIAPEIAENGNSVPVTVTVDSPMSATDYVRAIHIISDRNPLPGVASFMLGPDNGRAEVSLRMRMAESQHVIVVAEMSDGSAWTATREVKVTIGGCTT